MQNFSGFPFKAVPVALFIILLGLNSCRDEEQPAKVTFYFYHLVSDSALIKNSLIYTNLAGNKYEVDELQYFISDLKLWRGGQPYSTGESEKVHYVDIDIASTLEWTPDILFPPGKYDSVTCTFGLSDTLNQSGYFVNPPERDMFWPDMMGGGYHYMKMNGKWLAENELLEPFNLHLGRGMVESGSGDVTFVSNFFSLSLPLDNFYVEGSQLYQNVYLTMYINKWFETPNLWDWNIIGGQIMQYQDAMQKAAENGRNAFRADGVFAKPK
ncbi:MAG: hypothetical protein IPH88_17720 [Bacteroidales bacterium]|nr:hypothetical protein [Bacteroidales bacterium]